MLPFYILIAFIIILNLDRNLAETPASIYNNCNSPHVENVSLADVVNKRFYVVATTTSSNGASCQIFEINSENNPPESGVIVDKGSEESANYAWSSYSNGIFTYEIIKGLTDVKGLNGYLSLLYFNADTTPQSLALFTCPDKSVLEAFGNFGSTAAYPQTLLIMSTRPNISQNDIEALENQAKTIADMANAKFTAINQTNCNYN